MYAAIRKYSIKPGFIEEGMRRIQGDFVFLIRQEPGFLDYYAMRVVPNEVLTVSVFDTQAGAERSTPIAFEWVQKNLERFVQGVRWCIWCQLVSARKASLFTRCSKRRRP